MCRWVRVSPESELGCFQPFYSLLLALWEAAGATCRAQPQGGAECRGAELTLGTPLVEGRQGREAGHSTRLAGKYLEGCFHEYKNSARLLGCACRGWEGRAGSRPARKPV